MWITVMADLYHSRRQNSIPAYSKHSLLLPYGNHWNTCLIPYCIREKNYDIKLLRRIYV